MEENKELTQKNSDGLPIGDEEGYKGTKENNKGRHKVFAVIGAIVVAIIGIIGLIFGKVVEATLIGEIAKWALMSVVIAVIVCVICGVPITMLSDARGKLYPEYGKDGFKHLFKKR